MKHPPGLLKALCLILGSSVCLAEPLRMDAANPQENERVAPATYTSIVVTNTLPDPKVAYHIQGDVAVVEVEFPNVKELLEELPPEGVMSNVRHAEPEICQKLGLAADALHKAENERDIPTLVESLQGRLRERNVERSCRDNVAVAQALLKRTSREFQTYLPIESGMQAIVNLHRMRAGETEVVATKTFSTPSVGSIRASAFTGAVENNDERWFAKAADEGDGFIVTEERDRDNADFALALLLSWEPMYETDGWSKVFAFKEGAVTGSWAVGFGTKADDPMILAGYRIGIGQHLGLAFGYAGYNQSRLKGIYAGDGTDRVKDALTQDQLVEDTFSGGWWLGITLKP